MITHYIVTNREISSDLKPSDKKAFRVNSEECIRIDGAEESQDNLRYGEIRFNRKKIHKQIENGWRIELGQVTEGDVKLHIHKDLHRKDFLSQEDYEKEIRKKGFVFGSQKVFRKLYNHGIEEEHEGDILVFVHGYSTSLRESIQAVCMLDYLYIRKGSPIKTIVLFSWPSRNNILRYRNDARDAEKSGYAFARAIEKLRAQFRSLYKNGDTFCDHKLHLMCHSMGARVVEAMMAELGNRCLKPNTLFGEILIMAADVDDDALEYNQPMHLLISLSERIHIYYHNHDRALGISEKTKNAFNRLGRWGTRRSLPLPDEVFQADVTYINDQQNTGLKDLLNFQKGDLVNHWYYLKSASVRDDIIHVLNGHISVFVY